MKNTFYLKMVFPRIYFCISRRFIFGNLLNAPRKHSTPFFTCTLISLFVCFFLAGCAHQHLALLEEFAPYKRPETETKSKMIRLPVVLVPGVKGSVLKRGDKEFWGKSYTVIFDYKYDDLQFRLSPQLMENFQQKFKSYYYNEHRIHEGGILKSYKFEELPQIRFLTVSIYEQIAQVLKESGGYTGNKDFFCFAYDWRLDNRISAARLSAKIKQWQEKYKDSLKAELKEKFQLFWNELKEKNFITNEQNPDNEQIKVNIVAHSMGGLVSRYYLQMLGGSKNVNKLIMLGTPNLGAMDSLKALAKGEYPEAIFHFYYEESSRPIIFSWPSAFQLLPRYSSSLQDQDGNPVYLKEWGLGNSAISSDDLNKSLQNWKKYNLIPTDYDEKDIAVIDTFLKQQLEDAINFHLAINGKIDEKIKEYENTKLHSINSFLKEDEKIELQDEFQVGLVKTPIIIFGGYCDKTLKYAKLSGDDSKKPHLIFLDPKDEETVMKVITYGDGRVPTESIQFPEETRGKCNFKFLICEGHMGLVKNDTFQYNLLNELLQTSCINSHKQDHISSNQEL